MLMVLSMPLFIIATELTTYDIIQLLINVVHLESSIMCHSTSILKHKIANVFHVFCCFLGFYVLYQLGTGG